MFKLSLFYLNYAAIRLYITNIAEHYIQQYGVIEEKNTLFHIQADNFI